MLASTQYTHVSLDSISTPTKFLQDKLQIIFPCYVLNFQQFPSQIYENLTFLHRFNILNEHYTNQRLRTRAKLIIRMLQKVTFLSKVLMLAVKNSAVKMSSM